MVIDVPYLEEEVIQNDAERLLAEFAESRGVTVKTPIPIEDIVEKHLKLRIDFDDLHELLELPQMGAEPDIFGAIWMDKGEIYIHESLDPEENPAIEGRYRFTLAHEGGGHWRLHRRYIATSSAQTSLFEDTSKPAVICRSSQAKQSVEWQADFYASCLLMPKAMVLAEWRKKFQCDSPLVYDPLKDTLIANRPDVNALYMINKVLRARPEPREAHQFNNVAKLFAPIFNVSIQAMRIRLQNLGLLLCDRQHQRSLANQW